MWDFIIYLKCCKYDGCRVASRCCSRLVLRCESDSDLDSQGKTVERCILCKLSPGISELSGIAWKHGGCRKILNVTFWTKVTFDSLGQKIPRILLCFGIGGGWLTDGIPVAWLWRCSTEFWKIEIYGKMFPLFPFSFPFFLFLLLSLFFLFQSVKILRSSIFWRVAEIVENKFLYKNIKNKGKKILIKSRGEISTQIYFPIICLYMRTLLRGKKTPDHKSPDHKRSKKKIKEIIENYWQTENSVI